MFFTVAILFSFFILGYLYLAPTKKTQTDPPQPDSLQTTVKDPSPAPSEIPLKTPEAVPELPPKQATLPKLTPTAQILKPKVATYQVKKVSAATANKENFSSLGSFLLQETQKCVETLKKPEKSSSLPKNLNPLADSFVPS